jgi:photosystem II stability/assembly factor-like uncharacterized protein
MLSLLLWMSDATAHYPHDAAIWIAISPGSSPDWVATTVWRNEAWMLARTDNEQDVDVRYIMYGESNYLSAGALLTDTRLVIAPENGGMWVSEDVGETWSQSVTGIDTTATIKDIMVSPDVESDGIAIAVGTEGIWRTEDAGVTWSQVLVSKKEAILDVDLASDWSSSSRACAIGEHGTVWCSDDLGETWSAEGSTGGAPWCITVGDSNKLWAGLEDGLWQSTDGGQSWSLQEFSASVTTVEYLGDGVLLAALVREAVWRSDDDGATWSYQNDYLETADTSQGGPRETEHYFRFLPSRNGAVYLATWEGMVKSEDSGITWQRVHSEHQHTIRGVDLTRGADGEILALLASYGGGVVIVDDAVTKGASISPHASRRYLRNVAVTPDWQADGTAMFSGAGTVFVTSDGGRTWEERADGVISNIQKLDTSPNYTQDPVLLIAGGSSSTGLQLAASTNQGASWITPPLDERCGGGNAALFISWDWRNDKRAWAACDKDGTLYTTTNRGIGWDTVDALDIPAMSLTAAPGGEKTFLGSISGLYVSVNDGPLTLSAFEGEQIQSLAISPDWDADPTLYAIIASGGWYISEDGGDSWSRLNAPTDNYALSVAVSPDFVDDGIVAVAGYDGAYISHDRGQTWRWINTMELHEETSPQVITMGDWSTQILEGASGSAFTQTNTAGDVISFTFEGVAIEVLSPIWSNGGELSFSLDGGAATTASLSGAQSDSEPVWSASGLTDGWHSLTITVTDAPGAFDTARIWRQDVAEYVYQPGGGGKDSGGGTDSGGGKDSGGSKDSGGGGDSAHTDDTGPVVTDDTGTEPEKKCGCRGSQAGFLALLPLALWVRRRRS